MLIQNVDKTDRVFFSDGDDHVTCGAIVTVCGDQTKRIDGPKFRTPIPYYLSFHWWVGHGIDSVFTLLKCCIQYRKDSSCRIKL